MEDDRYYIPEITEFYEGFEYEFHGMTSGMVMFLNSDKPPEKITPEIKHWSKERCVAVITAATFMDRPIKDIPEILARGQIRVKYLDEADVKAFGFKETSDEGGTKVFENFIGGHKRESMWRVRLEDSGRLYITQGPHWVRFFGVIKNLSEFKKLLDQILPNN